METTTKTPLMAQYEQMKAKQPDAILLFRVGDFYETFKDDAVKCSEILGITLTKRAGTDGKTIALAGFPHQALDTYLPKLIRAGNRVAVCEALKDNKSPVTTPGANTSNDNEPKTENKPAKTKKMETKEINVTCNRSRLLELEEPTAYFTIKMPKFVKSLGKCACNDYYRPVLSNLCIEPESGKMIVSDTHVLHVVDIKAEGIWPKEDSPFRCYVYHKAISNLAGKNVDFAVWNNENNKHEITTCEAMGVNSQVQMGVIYPEWRRVVPNDDSGQLVRLSDTEKKRFVEFIKLHKGKNKTQKENTSLLLSCSGFLMTAKIYTQIDSWSDWELKTQSDFELMSEIKDEIKICFNHDCFMRAIPPTFTGETRCYDASRPFKFYGDGWQSIVMPIKCDWDESDNSSETNTTDSDTDTKERPF